MDANIQFWRVRWAGCVAYWIDVIENVGGDTKTLINTYTNK